MKNLMSWFLRIKWLKILTQFIFRILLIPLYILLLVIVVIAIVVNVLIFFVIGKGYIDEIVDIGFDLGEKIWYKAFPEK
jgi:hypothetical protein